MSAQDEDPGTVPTAAAAGPSFFEHEYHRPTGRTAAAAAAGGEGTAVDAAECEPPRLGAGYAARSWRTFDDMRAGGQHGTGTGPLRWTPQHKLKQRALGDQIRQSGFSFMRPLEGHISCINALAFSRDGRWLASGGDDMRVQIRDMYEDINSERGDVFVTLPGHRANIFTISWSCDGKHLFSGGNDGRVYQYDVSTLSNLAKRPRISPEPGQSRRALWTRQPSIPHSALLSAPATMTGLEFLLGTTPSIREVSAHPCNPSLLLACTQNGVLTMNDVRVPAPSIVARARLSARRGLFALSGRSFAGVQWRPLASDGNTFAACVSSVPSKLDVANVKLNAGTRLYDARMCFGSSTNAAGGHRGRSGGASWSGWDAAGDVDMSDPDQASILSDSNAVLVYDSIMERFERRGDDEVCAYFTMADGLNVRFDSTGEFLVTDVTGFKPIIYQIDQSSPIAVCEAKGYSTRCTTKHGSFGRFGLAWDDWARPPSATADSAPKASAAAQTSRTQRVVDEREGEAARENAARPRVERDGLYYVTGSDDFRGYGWAIPSVQMLRAQRQEVEELSILRGEAPTGGLYFVSQNGAPTWVPRLSEPAFTLEGAQSITNTVLAHPHLPLIATSGIERLVRLYSPLPFSIHDELPADGSLSVPLLRPGLTRERGKKPRQPAGANDERDSLCIAQTLLAHPSTSGRGSGTDSAAAAAADRLLRCRQLCREGDVDDAPTVLQFDEYLLEEEKERRTKRRRERERGAGQGQGSSDSRTRTRQNADEQESEGRELFPSRPDLVYRLRRLFDDTRRRSEGLVAVGRAVGPSTARSALAGGAGLLLQRSGSADGATALALGSSVPVPRATRPWRRTAGRAELGLHPRTHTHTHPERRASQLEQDADEPAARGSGGVVNTAAAAASSALARALRLRELLQEERDDVEMDASSDPGPMVGSSSSVAEAAAAAAGPGDVSDPGAGSDSLGDSSSASSSYDELEDDDANEDEDGLGDESAHARNVYDATGASHANAQGNGNSAGDQPTHNWLLRASRRLGLQQLSSHTPPKLAGGVWDVRQYTSSSASRSSNAAGPAGAPTLAERGLSLLRAARGMDEDGDEENEDEEEEERGGRAQRAHDDEGEDEDDDDDEFDPSGGTGGEITEYERWLRLELGHNMREEDDDDDDEGEEDDDEDEEEEDDDEGEGEEMVLDEEDEEMRDEGGDEDSPPAVAYRRLGRDRP
ncbi:hypothetical protein OC842_007019 [Tilletia horrida]|uniref:Uncharacterized protein n=1 Tax=Tilletia horrida TaxID=155126 RepID=A0AAN6G728_9BASI|nr:hypothetical protein OC842_007019 [Tilletia horrida]